MAVERAVTRQPRWLRSRARGLTRLGQPRWPALDRRRNVHPANRHRERREPVEGPSDELLRAIDELFGEDIS